MREIVEYFVKKGMIFSSMQSIDMRSLNSRKKVDIYLGVDMDGYYTMIIQMEKRSKILSKEALELMMLHESLERLKGHQITKIYILIKSQICKKAKLLLEDSGWVVENLSGE